MSRNGQLVHVSLPPCSLGFQIGETSQIHSAGILQATPHAVRGCRNGKISRESFAVFMEPEIDGDMDLPQGTTVEDVQRRTFHLPPTVRTLQSRWKPGMNFGEFSNATFAAFY
jgi:isopenicillin N synthase-like dioxygenase